MSSYEAYWNVAIEDVPGMTGAAEVMDLSDIREVLAHFGLALGDVIDVGCGTGRLAQACKGEYVGYDVAPSMVDYARSKGLNAHVVSGAAELGQTADLYWKGRHADTVCCLSVFTHISRPDRQAYLDAFSRIAPQVLVDILPGEDEGSIAVWKADPDNFETDLEAAGYKIDGWYERRSPDQELHRYYLAHVS